jgi:predicted nucleotidyltransferase
MTQNHIQATNILFSKVRQRVLGLLIGQPQRNFYTNEIIRLTQMGHGVVQRELEKLVQAGVLTFVFVGNQKHYKVNEKALLYEEIRGIVLKTMGLTDVLLQALKSCTKIIDIAFIYGSIAKHSETESSDIDVLLIGQDLTYIDIFNALSAAEMQLKRKINPTIYSHEEWHKRCVSDNHFVKNILTQPKIFLIGTENELRTFC